jgi:hypothetical protein
MMGQTIHYQGQRVSLTKRVRDAASRNVITCAVLSLIVVAIAALAIRSDPYVDPLPLSQPAAPPVGQDVYVPNFLLVNTIIFNGQLFDGDPAKGVDGDPTRGVPIGEGTLLSIDINGDGFVETIGNVSTAGRNLFFTLQHFVGRTSTPLAGAGTLQVDANGIIETQPNGKKFALTVDQSDGRIFGFTPKRL